MMMLFFRAKFMERDFPNTCLINKDVCWIFFGGQVRLMSFQP